MGLVSLSGLLGKLWAVLNLASCGNFGHGRPQRIDVLRTHLKNSVMMTTLGS